MGYFHWLRNSNLSRLQRELRLGYLKETEFYLKTKASFNHRSRIASIKLFLIARLWENCTFWDISVVSLKSSPWPKKKKQYYYQTFSLIQICSLLDCS